MAEVAGVSSETALAFSSSKREIMESCEPDAKKIKMSSDTSIVLANNLESRLAGILCCTVCLDLPMVGVYQCSNGHLMCVGCMSHLLADARLKDESATCPNCRCEISKTLCSRNLAVEKAVSELPTECKFCSQQLPRNILDQHERELCTERPANCKYGRIGCPWRGPFHELQVHEDSCCHPHKTGAQVMETLLGLDTQENHERVLQDMIFRLLSFEKIAFSDLQLKPYRTDDFITKLFYETSRFTAFNLQWVLKARVNDHKKSPNLTCKRVLSYQIMLKSKISAPIVLHYITLKGPYGDMRVNPSIQQHEFTSDSVETDYKELPLADYFECNKQLSAKTINLRLIMFQVQK